MPLRIVAAISVLLVATIPVRAQPAAGPAPEAQRAEILVLGVYHMANPGRDIFNMDVDDVLSPKRQAEIAELLAVLRKFQPTRIAVESNVSDSRVQRSYADYRGGKHELTRNEVQQLGFRLAKELGHENIYPVDVDGEFPFRPVQNWAKANGRSAELDSMMGEIGARVKAQNELLKTHTVLQTLLAMNDDARVAEDVGFYFRQAELGEPWDWAGAELVAAWFRRNMRIYSNVMRLVESPRDRVLVIYGAGHLGWLQYAFGSNPRVRLRKLDELVR